MVMELFSSIRSIISYIGVFVAIWALFVILATLIWMIFPIIPVEIFMKLRWFIALLPVIYLILSKKIKIN